MAKLKAKKQVKGKPPERSFPWLGLTSVLFIAAVAAVFWLMPPSQNSVSPQNLKAAIIDQLYTNYPNEDSTTQITKELRDYGFEVDVYQGDEVTVDLYRNLPGSGYRLIIFRAHSGLLGGEGEIIKRTCLFTNEPYSETRHVTEQLTDQLAKARIDEHHPWVFGIGDEFVTQSMEGRFDNTVSIMMGCSCLYLDDLAQAFIAKGASAYLAWDATVGLGYVDEATPYLIRQLCVDKVTVAKAVASTMNTIGPDPEYGARLKYFPPRSRDKTLEELLVSRNSAC